MSVVYKTLEKTSTRKIHQCFLASFADYVVDMRMSESMFHEVNQLRAVDYSISMGAFHDDNLIGFSLNGADTWNGKKTAYDAGTGVIPDFRGQGISKNIMRYTIETLAAQGFENYLLEVITGNTKALRLYESLDFHITRTFECMVLKKPANFPDAKPQLPIEGMSADRFDLLEKAMMDEQEGRFLPSWQNSWNTIRRRPELYHVLGCFDKQECLGYGVITVGRGTIAQLWVKPSRRRQGLGSQLLQELMARNPGQKNFSWVNIESTAEHTLEFLTALGFMKQLTQYEMERIIQPD